MIKLIFIVLVLFSTVSCAKEKVFQIEDKNLNYILNKFQLIYETEDRNNFPAIVRLITLPGTEESCDWLEFNIEIPTYVMEEGCPEKRLFLTLTNWDAEPNFYAYELGKAMYWKFISLDIISSNGINYWDAILKVEVQRINQRGLFKESINFKIKNRDDIYLINR